MVVGIVVSGLLEGPPDTTSGLDTLPFELQSRYVLAASDFLPGGKEQLYRQLQEMDAGTVGQRQRFVMLAAELDGREEARRKLARLEKDLAEHEVKLSAEQAAIQAALHRLYDGDGPQLEPEDRALLVDEVGWFGRLAVTSKDDTTERRKLLDEAQRTGLAIFGFGSLGCLGLCTGLVVLCVFLVMIAGKKVDFDIGPAQGTPGIYAETFAIWLVLFFALQWIAGAVIDPPLGLVVLLLVFFGSLLVLRWPVRRGIPWPQVKRDLGLDFGRGPFAEIGAGIASFLMMIPVLAVGIALMCLTAVIVKELQGPPEPFTPMAPSHPVLEYSQSPALWIWLVVATLVAVAAPVVEEILFRGALYRHVRSASSGLGVGMSIIVSGTVGAFVFAAIHPQGLIAVPALMCIAYGATIAREWRRSLVASMVVHALWNGSLLAFLTLALS